MRKHGFAIGRLFNAHPSTQDRYYFRILLNHAKSPKEFEDILKVDGIVHKNARGACYARLLDDDKEYVNGIKEASLWGDTL